MSIDELRQLLQGVPYGSLSRDELEHAMELLGVRVEQDDPDTELVGILKEKLG
jgi:acyl-CoA synthetase (NDP forming)